MSFLELILIGIALSMDAFAVGLTNGMTEPKMSVRKAMLIALFYGGFQCLMPILGYYGGSVFSALVEKIAPWLSFFLLAYIGGKMIYDGYREQFAPDKPICGKTLVQKEKLSVMRLTGQAVATSIDALAVGVSMLAQEQISALPFHAVLCAAIIGVITFFLSVLAVTVGKTAGNKLSDKAESIGGMILVIIGVKLLLEGILP